VSSACSLLRPPKAAQPPNQTVDIQRLGEKFRGAGMSSASRWATVP
jgi:hypothetical protein